jgi:large subunit ribosomal protein L18
MAKNRQLLRRLRVKQRVRGKISGTQERPRLAIFRSNKHIYAQVIDDTKGHTVASASSLEEGVDGNKPVDLSRAVGLRIAEKAKQAGVNQVVFDRSYYRYHGRVKALADAAREGGLNF